MLNRRQRIAAARLTGMTEAHTQLHRLVRDEALAGIAEVLAEFTPDVRTVILADVAASYVDGDRHHDQASAELLAVAGADIERARQLRAERDAEPNPLTLIAEQANRPEVERTGPEAAARFRAEFYADLERRGIHVTEEEREAARLRARQKLAEKDANQVTGLREELRRRFRTDPSPDTSA
jgi:hypothetical protein